MTVAPAAAGTPVAQPRQAKPEAIRHSSLYAVQLAEQADLSQEAVLPRGADRRAAAWADLEATARRTQPALTSKLDRLRSIGVVDGYRSAVLANTVFVDVDKQHETRFNREMQRLKDAGVVAAVERDTLVPGESPPDSPFPDPSPDRDWKTWLGAPFIGDGMGSRIRDLPTVAPHLEAIGVSAAWNQGITGKGVRIGLIDDGFDVTHPALRAAYEGTGTNHDYTWKDLTLGRTHPYQLKHDVHGTGMASVAVGRTRAGTTGVAPDAKFIGARLGFPQQTIHPDRYQGWSNLLTGLEWMLAPSTQDGSVRDARRGADIVSISLRDPFHSLENTMRTGVRQLLDAGVLVVEGAGNEGPEPGTIGSPSDLADVLTIGASDATGRAAPFSSRGPVHAPRNADEPRVTKPDLLAPGSGIVHALPGGGYASNSGTSPATPVAAGVAALIMSAYPSLDARDVADVLRASARDVHRKGVDSVSGFGLIDVPSALRLAKGITDERAAAVPAR